MQFPKSEYMKLITRLSIEKRPALEDKSLYTDDESDIYYSNALDQFQKNHKCKWNWAAALLQFSWLIYRGMFIYAFAYSLIKILTVFSLLWVWSYLYPEGPESLVGFIAILFYLFFDPILGKFGNRLYFRFLDKKIAKGWNLVPKTNTHGLLAFSFCFGWIFVFFIPYYLYKKVTFNRELEKARSLAILTT